MQDGGERESGMNEEDMDDEEGMMKRREKT
jgi:hypothetical protein